MNTFHANPADQIDVELAQIEAEGRHRASERAAAARRWGLLYAAVPVCGAAAALLGIAAIMGGSVSQWLSGSLCGLAGVASVVAATVPSGENQARATVHAHQLMKLSMDVHRARVFESTKSDTDRLKTLDVMSKRWMDIDASLPVVAATSFLARPAEVLRRMQTLSDPPAANPYAANPAPPATDSPSV